MKHENQETIESISEVPVKDSSKVSQSKNNHQRLNSVRDRDFLSTLGKRRLGVYLVV